MASTYKERRGCDVYKVKQMRKEEIKTLRKAKPHPFLVDLPVIMQTTSLVNNNLSLESLALLRKFGSSDLRSSVEGWDADDGRAW